MKEITDIVKAYQRANRQQLQTVLATVVHVEGSAYRQPGARMLITERGELTGAISGGCLEGDALRKALLVIQQQRSQLLTYDTNDEEDNTLGIGLGCNGIIHILLEPVNAEDPFNPVMLLAQLLEQRQPGVVVTLFNLQNRRAVQPGTCLVQVAGKTIYNNSGDPAWLNNTAQAFFKKQSVIFSRDEITGLIAYYPPPIQLLVAGAGNDVLPLANIAAILGWSTHVADGRPGYATPERFPSADSAVTAKASDILNKWKPDAFTAVVLMTHNYRYDLVLLQHFIQTTVPYIGVLGPAKKLQRMITELEDSGTTVSFIQREKIYGPAGLDLGAETSEEIALSVISEVKAAIAATNAAPLRAKSTTIHARERQIIL